MICTVDISSIITAICWKKFFSAVNKNYTDRPVILFFSVCAILSLYSFFISSCVSRCRRSLRRKMRYDKRSTMA